MPEAALSATGIILRQWRAARAKSQLDLALDAGISPRHLSFIETGRSTASREVLLLLSGVLDIPLRERNTLLQASGYAAIYRETPLDVPQMRQVDKAIEHILRAHTISPAVVVNRRYDVLRANSAAALLMTGDPKSSKAKPGRPNLLRLLLSPDCLRPAIENWEEVAIALFQRIRRESLGWDSENEELRTLLNEFIPPALGRRVASVDWTRPPEVVLPVRIRTDTLRLSFFSTITTLGTPCDITLQELRIEAFHPADQETEDTLLRLLRNKRSE